MATMPRVDGTMDLLHVGGQPDGQPLNLPSLGDIKISSDSTKDPAHVSSNLSNAMASTTDGSLSGDSSSGVDHRDQLIMRKPSVSRWKDQLTTVTHMLFYASTGDVEALSELINDGGDVNSADYDGRSALHLAASEGKLSTVQLLLQRGARVNPKDRWAHTPTTDATQGLTEGKPGQYREILELLRGKGGQSTVKDDWEIDPSEIDLKRAKLIGKGAFGEIRKVTWRGTPVAVKMILPSLSHDVQIAKEFQDEVSLLLKLRHPNVVQFLGAVTSSQPLMLITEYLPGRDLHEVIREHGALQASVAVSYALDIARGMNYLHNHKPEAIIHRDLKPRNLLRDEGDHLKVADFGLSKLIKVNSLHEMYKMTGETGSYRYMAPEVFRHEDYDCSVDVFSFAVIFYEMFEGMPPFAKTLSAEGVAWKIAMEAVRPPFKAKTYPLHARELISECWAATANQRPSFADIIERLEIIDRDLAPMREVGSPSSRALAHHR